MPSDFPEHLDRQPPPDEPPRRRGLGDRRVVLGLGAAAVLGIVGGLVMKPNLDDQPPPEPTNRRTVEIPREPDWLDIVVDRAPPPEPVTPLGPPPSAAPDEVEAPAREAPPPRIDSPPRPDVRPPTPRQRARPSFNCRYARTTAERMVCVDPHLAAADRRLARAYREAVEAGVPERVLRRQQDVWLGARESAARYGPEDVARVYEARIAELEQMTY